MLCHRYSGFSLFSVALSSLLMVASLGSAVETTIIATGLDRPTAVAVVGEQVFYADAAGLHSLDKVATPSLSGAIHSLAGFGNERLIVSAEDVSLWSFMVDPLRLELNQTVRTVGNTNSKPFTSLTIDERHAFALRNGRIYRSRRAGKGLTSLRAFGTSWAGGIRALALNERGYLVLLQADEAADTWRLVFCDPNAPEGEPLAAWKVPLAEPLALAYSPVPSPTEHQLYALGSDGVYRLDAAVGDTIGITRIASIAHPIAMAFAPNGLLYVATLTDDGAGVLLRLDGSL